MATVLISGGADRAERLAERMRGDGHTVRLTDPADLASLARESVDYYLQLPVMVRLSGDTLVGRVRSFLAGGLLARFSLVEQLLPALRPGAGVVLVAGNTSGVSSLPDDRRSRLALLHVLAHACRAELTDHAVRVEVVDGERSDQEIAHCLLGGKDDGVPRPSTEFIPMSGRQYDDWRTEVMGMLSPVAA
jgi:hypothetical protein